MVLITTCPSSNVLFVSSRSDDESARPITRETRSNRECWSHGITQDLQFLSLIITEKLAFIVIFIICSLWLVTKLVKYCYKKQCKFRRRRISDNIQVFAVLSICSSCIPLVQYWHKHRSFSGNVAQSTLNFIYFGGA